MKIIHEKFLIEKGSFSSSNEFKEVYSEVKNAILSVTWNSQTEFIINPVKKGNGVKPIKNNFVTFLRNSGWELEKRMSLAQGMNPGPIDATRKVPQGTFAVEWETGNISSSHRALNKIAIGILQKQIIGGILVLPIKNFSQYLTDRIGRYEELAPYFPLYEKLSIEEGVIVAIGVEHDKIDSSVSLIPKGNDGYGNNP